MPQHIDRIPLKLLVSLTQTIVLTGCNHSPSQELVGSYFPSWMLCALGGIFLTLIIRKIVVQLGIDNFLPAKLLLYAGLALSVTFILWIVWYGH
jgi:hypothetical protein